ncbi:DUF4329 domain-containing protein [Candidatus Rhodobacter oscarellae]|uniref:DUF4329 domain-containing protein n=1 Tax=Candidatus Rhodobacter oscarellae TaxID=1675527 RepID=UPI0009E58102|nr:DUF4329 domain-containing protein [Candidatus Rhodobacter lobularis]
MARRNGHEASRIDHRWHPACTAGRGAEPGRDRRGAQRADAAARQLFRGQPRDPRDAAEIIASFHTHGGFDEDADSEVPSVSDVLADMEEGLDGYLSTPGGRFWFIDGQTGVSRQLCGLGCLPQDPDFAPGLHGTISKRYTLGQLEARENE